MNRQQKESVVELLQDKLTTSQASFFVSVKGLTVTDMQLLRGKLREKGGKLKVAKARLMKLAVENLDQAEGLKPFCKEQIGFVFAEKEVTEVAKVLHNFSKDNDFLKLLVGHLDSQLLSDKEIIRIASLPSKEILLAQLCAGLNAPTSNFVRVLNALILRLLWVLNQIKEKKS